MASNEKLIGALVGCMFPAGVGFCMVVLGLAFGHPNVPLMLGAWILAWVMAALVDKVLR